MKRYINQLTVAKKQCEKRIRLLGGPNYEQQEDGAQDEGDGPQSQRVQEEITGTETPTSKPVWNQNYRIIFCIL